MEPRDPGRVSAEPNLLRLQLLGVPQWHLPSGESRPLSRKDALLVGILALDGPQARQLLAGRLWPDVNEAHAAASLRQRFTRLRRDTGHRIVQTAQSVRLADGVAVDTATIGGMSAEALIELGELLAGFDYADNDLINGWVATHRGQLRRTRSDALVGHACRLEARGELASALRLSDCILTLTPLREHAWRHQMRLHYLRGDRSSAIQAFERFESVLRDETGARPSEETLELLRMIEASGPGKSIRRALVPACLVRPPQLVGRDKEWQAMTRAWSAGKAFLLLADAGMGKSRLLGDYLHGRAGVLLERGQPGDRQTPHAVLARLLKGVWALHPPLADDPACKELAQLLPGAGAAAAGIVTPAWVWRAAEAALAAANALGLSALVVDDLHHADRATLEALRWLSASPLLAGLQFGLATRPPADTLMADVLHEWLVDSYRPESIVLEPLTLRDVDALVASLDVPEFLVPGLAERLFRHAGGHPLFTLETLKDALLQGHAMASDPLPTPAAVRTLLQRHLGSLPRRAMAVLHVAAVAGPELTVERAARMLGRSPCELARPWADLESAYVLRGHQFAHELVRQSALGLVPQAVQRVLHATLAALLEGEAGVTPARIAVHWEAAGRWNEAAACWLAAGQAARHACRRSEQKLFLQRAAACELRTDSRSIDHEGTHAGWLAVRPALSNAAVL